MEPASSRVRSRDPAGSKEEHTDRCVATGAFKCYSSPAETRPRSLCASLICTGSAAKSWDRPRSPPRRSMALSIAPIHANASRRSANCAGGKGLVIACIITAVWQSLSTHMQSSLKCLDNLATQHLCYNCRDHQEADRGPAQEQVQNLLTFGHHTGGNHLSILITQTSNHTDLVSPS